MAAMNTLFYYSRSAQDRMLPRIHAQSLNHSRESRYVSGAGGMVVRKSSGRCVAHVEEGRSQENPWGLLASSLAIKGKHGPRFRERPVRKEQVESDQSTEASWQSCMQTGAGTMWESFLLQAQTKLLIRKNTVHPRSSCALQQV